MHSARSKNPWGARRLPTVPFLALGIGLEPKLAIKPEIDVSPERHLREKVESFLKSAHRHISDRLGSDRKTSTPLDPEH